MTAKKRDIGFAICVTAGQEDDLQEGKVYRILPDPKAAEVGCRRVIDDSEENYLYAAKRFVVVEVPEKERGRIIKVVRREPTLPRR